MSSGRMMRTPGRLASRPKPGSTTESISTIPVSHGERLVMRLLPDSQALLDLETIGFSEAQLGALERVIRLYAHPEYSLEHRVQTLPYKHPAEFDRVVEGLRKAGLPEA